MCFGGRSYIFYSVFKYFHYFEDQAKKKKSVITVGLQREKERERYDSEYRSAMWWECGEDSAVSVMRCVVVRVSCHVQLV